MNKISLTVPYIFILLAGSSYAEVSSLCGKEENAVWSCQTGKKIYSLCASMPVTETTGYVQYRAGTKDKITFNFPATHQHPKGNFEYGLLPQGAFLTFNNGGYEYRINEPLIGQPIIIVSGKDNTILQCNDSTQSLTNNATIDLFRSAGVFQ
ncbi:hypothetical protein ACFQ0F_06060 [Paraperlucidibaca wandonensis]|uniref:Uncharacterized protein n=1 Tax=Paraperlucidibaca wandonensis TaxID=1268273 RepID=A0ABW3HFH4_9GAMM